MPPPDSTSPDDRPRLDTGALQELHAVLGDEFVVLVRTWQTDSEHRLALMRSALSAGDASRLREAAHSLKGSSLNLGAMRLGDYCLALENAACEGALARVPSLLAAAESEYQAVAPLLAASPKG